MTNEEKARAKAHEIARRFDCSTSRTLDHSWMCKAIAAALRDARREALEEAAVDLESRFGTGGNYIIGKAVAERIRALIQKGEQG